MIMPLLSMKGVEDRGGMWLRDVEERKSLEGERVWAENGGECEAGGIHDGGCDGELGQTDDPHDGLINSCIS